MRIVLDRVSVEGRRTTLLAPTSFTVSTGEVVLLAAEPGHGNTALALAVGGRLTPVEGEVRLEDTPETRPPLTLRDVVALVDVPGVSEPEHSLHVSTQAAEALAVAHRPSWRSDVRRWLDTLGLGHTYETRIDQLAPLERTTLCVGAATEMADVHFLMMTLPDRHGGAAAGWWELALDAARAGYGVIVTSSRASARILGAQIPADTSPDPSKEPPVVALRVTPEPRATEPAEAPGTAEAAEPAGAVDPAEPTGSTGPAESTGATEPSLATEPSGAVEPTGSRSTAERAAPAAEEPDDGPAGADASVEPRHAAVAGDPGDVPTDVPVDAPDPEPRSTEATSGGSAR